MSSSMRWALVLEIEKKVREGEMNCMSNLCIPCEGYEGPALGFGCG